MIVSQMEMPTLVFESTLACRHSNREFVWLRRRRNPRSHTGKLRAIFTAYSKNPLFEQSDRPDLMRIII